jgi:hypothetical protein
MGDWGSPQYIVSQVFVILAYCCLGFTYLIKKRSAVLVVVMTSNFTMGVGFSLLSAWVGVGMCAVAITRDTVSSIINRKRSEMDKNKITGTDWVLLCVWVTALSVITVLTENGFLTWFALFATLTFTISIWQKNVFVYKFLGIFVGIFWIIYNISIENFFGVILEGVLFVAVIIGLILYIVKNKKSVKGKSAK